MIFFNQTQYIYKGKLLKKLLYISKNTSYGSKYNFKNIITYSSFAETVPIVSYEDLYPEIKKILNGKQNVLWPEKINWFAKSSGTTNDKSKYIPVSKTSLDEGHYKAGTDLLSIYLNNYSHSNLFDGKALALGGSKQINPVGRSNKNIYWRHFCCIIKKPSLLG